MPATSLSNSGLKAACSVSELAQRCGLSRARWYELVRGGIMPPPCYCVHTRRALYPREIQELAINLRMTNTALDGRYVVFNNRQERSSPTSLGRSPARRTARPAVVDPNVTEMIESLRALGIEHADVEIKAAISACYPGGLPDDFEMALTTVFRHLKRLERAR